MPVSQGGDAGTAELWRRYRARRDAGSRAALMLAYWPLVKEVAASVSTGLPPHVDEGDLISAGLFGLLSAIERHQPADGRRFEAFAHARVRGAIIDEIRALDWAPRHVRERAREVREASALLEQKLRRQATQAEVARALGITPDQAHARLAGNLLASVGALDGELEEEPGGEPLRLIDTVQDASAVDPVRSLQDDELRAEVIEAIARLPWRERRILTFHYRRGLTLREIGDSLGITESRVSQVHAAIMRRLRDEIQAVLAGEAFPLRIVVEAAAEALERLDPFASAQPAAAASSSSAPGSSRSPAARTFSSR